MVRIPIPPVPFSAEEAMLLWVRMKEFGSLNGGKLNLPSPLWMLLEQQPSLTSRFFETKQRCHPNSEINSHAGGTGATEELKAKGCCLALVSVIHSELGRRRKDSSGKLGFASGGDEPSQDPSPISGGRICTEASSSTGATTGVGENLGA
ncbi:hypothetical protein U1Q18_045042 [Sarracenia purpurea var. burkii]